MTEQEALISLNAIPGVGNARIRQLIAHFGKAREVFSRGEKLIEDFSPFSRSLAEQIVQFDYHAFLKKEWEAIRAWDVKVLTVGDQDYPEQLEEIPDAPCVLYVRGQWREGINPAVALVGARSASLYGLTMADKFASRLAELGITVVSGMARGVDTAVHQGCLRAGGRTVAVLGCGLARIYPSENKSLAERILEKGALVSEFAMEVPPLPYHFPRRNRIISGLSLGVVVVEASSRSGALITARCALEQGREVFAVPGRIDQQNTQGVHQLIKEGAKLVNCVEDILEELHAPLKQVLAQQKENEPMKTASSLASDGQEQRGFASNWPLADQEVIRAVQKGPIYIDDILNQCQYSAQHVADSLLRLEIKHHIQRLPGNFYALRESSFPAR